MPHDELERWKAARHRMAHAVLMDRVYAPVFERIEREIAALEAENDLVERAGAVVQGHKLKRPT